MKAHNIIKSILALSLAVIAVASCQEKMKGFGFTKGEAVKFSVGSAGSSLDTKAAYSGVEANSKERIDWEAGDDLIRIYCDAVDEPSTKWADYAVTSAEASTTNPEKSLARIAGTGGVGLRWGEGEHIFYAAYPSPASGGIATDITGKTVTGNLTSGDQGNKGKTETSSGSGSYVVEPDLKWMLMTAKAGPYTEGGGIPTGKDNDKVFLDFQPLTTAIEFTIYNGNKNAPLNVNKIMLISENTQISGTFTVDLDTMEGGYAKCTGTAPGSKQVCIDFSSLGISLAEATGDGTANCKSLKFTFFLAPTTDVSDLTFKLYKNENDWMSTKLGYTDGSGVKFPRCKKTFVTGLLVPEGAQWTVKYGPDVDTWLTDDSDIDPKPEVSGNPIVTSWNTGIEAPLDLEVSKPDLLPGKFSINATEYVQFSKGNLFCIRSGSVGSYTYSFGLESNQYDFRTRPGNYAVKNGVPMATGTGSDESGLFQYDLSCAVDGGDFGAFGKKYPIVGDPSQIMNFGKAIGPEWYTLTKSEWFYLLTEHVSVWCKVKGIYGYAFAPDGYDTTTQPWTTTGNELSNWEEAESAGVLFIPAAGFMQGEDENFGTVYADGSVVPFSGYSWTSTADGTEGAWYMGFGETVIGTYNHVNSFAFPERLVQKFFKPHDAVKIGDLYWATTNIGASTPKDYGWYFSWGNTTGYINKNYQWIEAKNNSKGLPNNGFYDHTYSSTAGYSLTGDIPVNSLYDAARANWGGTWRMPTADEFNDLKDKTAWAWGDGGYYVFYPVPSGKSKGTECIYSSLDGFDKESAVLFFPANGFSYDGNQVVSAASDGYYWTRTIGSDNKATHMYSKIDEGGQVSNITNSRFFGMGIRPVHD